MIQPHRFRTSPDDARPPQRAGFGRRGALRASLAALLLLVVVACGTTAPPTTDELTLDEAGVTPTSGNFTDTVTLTGANISGDATVLVCGEPATDVIVRNADGVAIGGENSGGVTITFNPPVLTADATCDIVVEQGEGDAAESETLEAAFSYVAEVSDDLTLADVEPASGGEGDTITVTGINIAGDTTVTVCGEGATNVVVTDETDATVEAGVEDGVQIQFDLPAGIADGECDIVVSQGAGEDEESATLAGEFTYVTVSTSTAIRINAGGPAVDTSVGTFAEDQFFVGGSVYVDGSPIENTDDDTIYQTERDGYVDPDHGSFAYEIPVDDGDYTLILHFAELFIGTDKPAAAGTGVGSREFSYSAEGVELEDAYDVYLEAGEQPYFAVVETYMDITVDDGVLNLEFTQGLSNSPFVSAIQVIPQ